VRFSRAKLRSTISETRWDGLLTENLEKLIRDATERLFLGKAIEFAARLARSVSRRTPRFLGDTRPGIPGNDPPTKASGRPPLSQGSAFTDVVALTGVHRPSKHRLSKTQDQRLRLRNALSCNYVNVQNSNLDVTRFCVRSIWIAGDPSLPGKFSRPPF
jgi:hypothetical protein